MAQTDMTSATDEIAALAKRFFAGLEAGDKNAVGMCYADDAEIWHNTDGIVQSKADNLGVLDGFFAAVTERRYADARLDVFEDGFVQQHRLLGNLPNGRTLDWPACIVCRVREGKIVRLDEYFDSAGAPSL
ncbi:ketosteroid isomerase-like protein [Parvibaculum indicum]|uniref:nuclear transport factor 2 family protein n=1 Tax=Parvibaculum indicum TaxID=562969 RepID=UPI00141FF908|nr:nuclear transport factor 2 family protein [Parvibaculum indicum]NIJ41119.1 ketosteroid isomerase-like protein [Parvibaculum indicum]